MKVFRGHLYPSFRLVVIYSIRFYFVVTVADLGNCLVGLVMIVVQLLPDRNSQPSFPEKNRSN
jgi:hypothetical protein